MDPIDLRSDTVTRPSEGMREAAAAAEVGDDVYREDPTVNDLQDRVADLFGTEAALYFPTGTMANQAAVRAHTERGQEVVCDVQSHLYNAERAGLAQLCGVQGRPIDPERGTPTVEDVRAAYRPPGGLHAKGTGLLSLENTHNVRGGLAIAPDRIERVAAAAAELDVPTHLDGARLWNASVAHGVPVERFVGPVDSVMVSLMKGLGAPVGAVLAGDEAVIESARETRKLLGGGMRQAGIVAAPGLMALENVDRLAEDHEHARLLAGGLDEVDGLDVAEPETNIVLADVSGLGMDASGFRERAADAGVRHTVIDDHRVRFVTHWDVDRGDVEAAVERVRAAV